MLGVRHEPHDVADLVADPGDVADRSVRVVDVAEHDLRGVEIRRGDVAAVAVLDRQHEARAGGAARGERQVVALDGQRHVAADEAKRLVAQQRAREQARLAEDLEAVADPEHEAARVCELAHGSRRRREAAIAPQRR